MAGDWRQATLGAIAVQDGYGLVDGPFGSNLPSSCYTESGVPVIRGSNLTLGSTRFKADEFVYVSTETAQRLARSLCRPGDIIFTKKGTLGQTGLVPNDGEHKIYLLSSNQMKLTVDPTVADALFVYYYVSSPLSTAKIIRDSEATGVPKTNVAYLRDFPILLPPLPEQRAIAHILGTLDDKIELNRRMNATLEATAQALFRSWFVDFDPVLDKALAAGNPIPAEFANRAAKRAEIRGQFPPLPDHILALFPDTFQDSDLGPIPEGWEVDSLERIASVTMGLSPAGSSYNAEALGTPLINGPVEFGDHFPERTKWTTAPTRLAQAGDLILCVRGSTTGRRVVADGCYCLGRGVCAVRPKSGLRTVLYQTLDTGLGRLLSKTTGSVFPNLSAPDIKGLPIISAPQPVTQAFGREADPLTEQREANVKESRTLAALRDELLPKLISGAVRANEDATALRGAL